MAGRRSVKGDGRTDPSVRKDGYSQSDQSLHELFFVDTHPGRANLLQVPLQKSRVGDSLARESLQRCQQQASPLGRRKHAQEKLSTCAAVHRYSRSGLQMCPQRPLTLDPIDIDNFIAVKNGYVDRLLDFTGKGLQDGMSLPSSERVDQ